MKGFVRVAGRNYSLRWLRAGGTIPERKMPAPPSKVREAREKEMLRSCLDKMVAAGMLGRDDLGRYFLLDASKAPDVETA